MEKKSGTVGEAILARRQAEFEQLCENLGVTQQVATIIGLVAAFHVGEAHGAAKMAVIAKEG